MMKSFFKKLAFVMALAMVVTMAAPAGTSALAADLYVAYQGKTEAITEVTLDKVGDKVDLCFKNAPTNWKDDFSWTSADPTVVTVDEAGVVVAKKEGTTVVTCQVLGVEVDVVVTVGKVPAATSYKVEQTTATTINVIFNGKHNYKASDIELFYVVEGGNPVSWPLEEVKAIDGGFSVKPYVNFEDGDNYILKVKGDKGVAFTTTFGTLTHLVIDYKCNNKTNEGGFVDPKGETTYPVEFSVKFFSGTVDVTELGLYNQEEVIYNLVRGDEDSLMFDPSGEIVFYTAGAGAVVSAEYVYYDAAIDEEVKVESLDPVGLASKSLPVYKLTGLNDWAIVKIDSTPSYADIDWTKKSIKANDDADADYAIVAKFNDSYGNVVITDDRFADTTKKIYGPTSEYGFAGESYGFRFRSANNNKLLIGYTDAEITTYTGADVTVIVELVTSNLENAKDASGFVRNAGAFTVAVSAERYIDKVTLAKNSTTVISDAKNNDEKFLNTEIKLYIKDQYGEDWKEDIEITVTSNVTGVGLNLPEGTKLEYKAADKCAKIILKGDELYADVKAASKSSVTFTFEPKSSGRTTKLTVTPKAPYYYTGGTDIRVSSYQLAATDVELKVDSSSKTPISNSIALTQISNSHAVGLEADITVLPADATTLTKLTTSKNDRYLAVYKPNGDVITSATGNYVDASGAVVGTFGSAIPETATKAVPTSLGLFQNPDGTYSVCTGVAVDDTMTYYPTGDYTVVIKKVTGFKTGDDGQANLSNEFNGAYKVANNSPKLAFNKLNFTEDNSLENATNYNDLLDIVKAHVLVNKDGQNWEFTKEDVVEIYGRYNQDAGYVILTGVLFNVPLNGTNDAVGYEAEIEINQAIELQNDLVHDFTDGIYVVPVSEGE